MSDTIVVHCMRGTVRHNVARGDKLPVSDSDAEGFHPIRKRGGNVAFRPKYLGKCVSHSISYLSPFTHPNLDIFGLIRNVINS